MTDVSEVDVAHKLFYSGDGANKIFWNRGMLLQTARRDITKRIATQYGVKELMFSPYTTGIQAVYLRLKLKLKTY
jgi:hypothetical protein